MIKTVCAKFRKQKHPNNTLLLTWAAFLTHFRPILHDLFGFCHLRSLWTKKQPGMTAAVCRLGPWAKQWPKRCKDLSSAVSGSFRKPKRSHVKAATTSTVRIGSWHIAHWQLAQKATRSNGACYYSLQSRATLGYLEMLRKNLSPGEVMFTSSHVYIVVCSVPLAHYVPYSVGHISLVTHTVYILYIIFIYVIFNSAF